VKKLFFVVLLALGGCGDGYLIMGGAPTIAQLKECPEVPSHEMCKENGTPYYGGRLEDEPPPPSKKVQLINRANDIEIDGSI
jgi:hypothetical protein